MGTRIPWSEYEAVIIVNAFYQCKAGIIRKKDAVKKVSDELRRIAVAKGIAIDDVFRNENGIAMQMATLEHIYTEGKSGLRSGSKLFRETMRLFSEDPDCFSTKLVEACLVGENTMDKFSEFLLAHFAYGIRVDSPIELMRLKRFYVEDYEEECPWTDNEIKSKILSNCFFHEGKGYVLSDKACAAILSEIEELRASGSNIIYYSELYGRNEEWFLKQGIFSDEMLKSFVKKYSSNIVCKKAYFSWEALNENELLQNNILSVWDDEVLHDYYELKERLEYVPIEKIKYALANNSCFVWNSAETYMITSKFIITEDEKCKILEYVERIINEVGHVSFDDIPLQSVFDENYELSETAIFTLVFDRILSMEYERYNRVISRKGNEKDAVKLVEDYCRTKREISLDELLEQWKLRTGTHRQAEPLDIAYATMIRVDVNRFVCDAQVEFNIPGIDEVLDTLVVGEAIGLKEIASFALFPECNFAWNLFLVESFCRRYSKTFKYMAVTTNSRNAGAIVRKECNLDYHNLLANVLVSKKVELTEDVVMDYLYDNGFIARHSYKYLKDLIELALRLNEGR